MTTPGYFVRLQLLITIIRQWMTSLRIELGLHILVFDTHYTFSFNIIDFSPLFLPLLQDIFLSYPLSQLHVLPHTFQPEDVFHWVCLLFVSARTSALNDPWMTLEHMEEELEVLKCGSCDLHLKWRLMRN